MQDVRLDKYAGVSAMRWFQTESLVLSTAIVMLAPPLGAATLVPPVDFTIAFIGDQGVGPNAVAVLELIAAEDADMVLHQGDLGYTLDATLWDQQIDDTLGFYFPYFGTIGNHDCLASVSGCSGPGDWPDYRALLQERLDRIPGAVCVGELGVNMACTYMGIFFVFSGVGTLGTGHDAFISGALGNSDAIWRICAWHKNHQLMQVGLKSTEVQLSTYDACRAGGAIIATAHEHSYSRTHLMSSFASQTVLSTSSLLTIGLGQTFAFVSGLGGHSIRAENPLRAADPWWANIYTSTQGAQYGALFCSFNHLSVVDQAHCYFKDVDGVVADEFDIATTLVPEPMGTAPQLCALGTVAPLARRRRCNRLRAASCQPVQI